MSKITIWVSLKQDTPKAKEFDNNQDAILYLYDLVDYIEKEESDIFLVSGKGCYGDTIVSENIRNIVDTCLDLLTKHDMEEEIHVQEYKTFEDAYKVALDMREGHPKCLN